MQHARTDMSSDYDNVTLKRIHLDRENVTL
jgi:hypothetical protein